MADGTGGEGTGEGDSPWAGAGLDETQTGYITNKGWANTGAMLDSYQKLEQHVGLPPDRLIRMPADDAKPEEWNSVWTKLGRPENAAGYGDFKLPEGAPSNEGRTTAFKDFAHGIGLSTSQANAIAGWDAQFIMDAGKVSTDATNLKLDTELNELRTEWGAAFDDKMMGADRAAKEFGLEQQDIVDMQKVWGRAKTGKFLASVGSKMGEHGFETGEARRFNSMSPGEAGAKIQELNGDTAFMSRYMKGEAGAVKVMNDLQALKAAKG